VGRVGDEDGVAEGQEGVDGEHAAEQLHRQGKGRRHERGGVEAREAVEPVALVPQDDRRHGADDGDLQKPFDELNEGLAPEQPLHAGHRRDPTELRL
jgi:hypothetical protein